MIQNRLLVIAALCAAVGCSDDADLEKPAHATGSNPAIAGGGGGGTTTPPTDGGGGGTGPVPDPAPAPDSNLVAYTSRQELADVLDGVASTNTWWFTNPQPMPTGMPTTSGPVAPSSPSAGPSGAPSAGPSGAAGSSSSTTVQEVGVDEADVMKHDGRYLYICQGNRVRVVDTRPLVATAQVASCPVEGAAVGTYVVDGRLVVLSQCTITNATSVTNCTGVTVFDITDPTGPVEVGARFLDGALQASRCIDGRLVVVQSHSAHFTPEMTADERVDAYLPNVRHDLADPGTDVIAATAVYHPREATAPQNTLTTVCTLSVADVGGPVDAIGAAVYAGYTTYVATASLYLTHGTSVQGNVATMFHKMRLLPTGAAYAGSGHALGRLLNSYSCGEYQGYLRVATRRFQFNTQFWAGGTPSTAVTVLGEVGGRLAIVGSVTDIEPGETLNTARFLGDRGYLITSVQAIDPLFTLDLSVPSNPRVMGEFTYDGVADFLYPVAADRLLAVGRQSINGRFAGVQCSLFDVSDLRNPTRVAVLNLAGTEGSTDVQWDPHAFTWYGARGLFSLPVRRWSVAGTTWAGGQDIDVDVVQVERNGLTRLGALNLASSTYYPTGTLRSVFLDDDVLGVAPDRVVGNVVTALGAGQITVLLP